MPPGNVSSNEIQKNSQALTVSEQVTTSTNLLQSATSEFIEQVNQRPFVKNTKQVQMTPMLRITIIALATLAISACSTTTPPIAPVDTEVSTRPNPIPPISQPSDSSIAPLTQRMEAGFANPPSCGDTRSPSSESRVVASEWTVAQACIDLIKYYEGFEPSPYVGPGGVQLIGYGHAILPDENLTSVTQAEAENLLIQDVAERGSTMAQMIEVPVTQNEFSAMVCLAYSMDIRRLGRDSTMTALNNEQYRLAADQITTIRRADGQILRGLVERRQQECSLFLSP